MSPRFKVGALFGILVAKATISKLETLKLQSTLIFKSCHRLTVALIVISYFPNAKFKVPFAANLPSTLASASTTAIGPRRLINLACKIS